MNFLFVEREREKGNLKQVMLFSQSESEGSHLITIYHKPGMVDLSKYPTDADEVFGCLKEGKAKAQDSLLYAVAGIPQREMGQITLCGFSAEGFQVGYILNEDVPFLDEQKMLNWDLERFRQFVEDMA
jgi:hypothetical protein